jgi:hypothetical protein
MVAQSGNVFSALMHTSSPSTKSHLQDYIISFLFFLQETTAAHHRQHVHHRHGIGPHVAAMHRTVTTRPCTGRLLEPALAPLAAATSRPRGEPASPTLLPGTESQAGPHAATTRRVGLTLHPHDPGIAPQLITQVRGWIWWKMGWCRGWLNNLIIVMIMVVLEIMTVRVCFVCVQERNGNNSSCVCG